MMNLEDLVLTDMVSVYVGTDETYVSTFKNTDIVFNFTNCIVKEEIRKLKNKIVFLTYEKRLRRYAEAYVRELMELTPAQLHIRVQEDSSGFSIVNFDPVKRIVYDGLSFFTETNHAVAC